MVEATNDIHSSVFWVPRMKTTNIEIASNFKHCNFSCLFFSFLICFEPGDPILIVVCQSHLHFFKISLVTQKLHNQHSLVSFDISFVGLKNVQVFHI